ncbi:Superoxide dismutase [Mn] [Candidatus Nitrosotalea sp. TS]|nr:Superoxide dismutase [Mn] [Candidatus Nitrosotalea sp. TS]
MGKYELPPLPYSYDSLEPYIDEVTMKNPSHKTSSGLC